MNRKLITIGVLVLILGLSGYYTLSPLWKNIELHDPNPETTEEFMRSTMTFPVIGTKSHRAEGTARVLITEREKILRFENFSTVNGPNLHLYLSKDLEAKDVIDLGPIKGTNGEINYIIPEEIDLEEYRYVLHWCVPFGVLFNYVDLVPEEIPISAGEVDYWNGVTGYFAEPKTEGIYPGVVMIHEWWGLNDQIRETTEELAKEGYRVLAVDLFGAVATTTEEARMRTSSLDQEEALKNLQGGVEYLKMQGSERIGSLGWCFGGGQSLQLALAEEDLDATVIYYGRLVTDHDLLKTIEQPVLGIFGEEDQSVASSTVRDFSQALLFHGISNEIYMYPGVGHAFANPSGPNHASQETKDAWEKTLRFLEKNLR